MPIETEYKSYLLRLWKVTSAGNAIWRASLEEPESGTRLGFACLEQLFAFLMDQTSGAAQLRAGAEPTDDWERTA